MSTTSEMQIQCWQCQSLSELNATTCHACGANLFGGITDTPPALAPYPRYAQTNGTGLIQVPAGTHSIALVIILSILFGGWTGMLVNRQVVKGLVFGLLLGCVFTYSTCGLGFLVWYPLTLVDAILVAIKLNRGQAVREWEFF
jgi:hypothetical protein